MLKLSLTDGKNNFQALEVEHISALRNNVDKALRSLQKTDSRYNNAEESREPREPRGKREKKPRTVNQAAEKYPYSTFSRINYLYNLRASKQLICLKTATYKIMKVIKIVLNQEDLMYKVEEVDGIKKVVVVVINHLRDIQRTIEIVSKQIITVTLPCTRNITVLLMHRRTNRRDFNVTRNLNISINTTEAEKRIRSLLSRLIDRNTFAQSRTSNVNASDSGNDTRIQTEGKNFDNMVLEL
ncbi:uncharacterized protein LOC112454512 isoform X2 [Temnothorax curvispinosus]|uniref:Uncharacterized protein LOC112454512 isoform X2 n=1 Tax=Temnothorax curvispinosus TaxID=300111 RepID=A0A6J1PPQ8_9HYME|nr:uncharacterized protein LOC112454512 isoform X2 [Temnothorax curvispinosus]